MYEYKYNIIRKTRKRTVNELNGKIGTGSYRITKKTVKTDKLTNLVNNPLEYTNSTNVSESSV